MALNAASHNIRELPFSHAFSPPHANFNSTAGEKTGPVSGQPPAVAAETTEALVSASEKDPQGQNAPGRDGGDAEAPKKQKTEKERTQSYQGKWTKQNLT